MDTKPRLDTRWHEHHLCWVAWTDTECILVDPDIYQRLFIEELARHGIDFKTWGECMRIAQEGWRAQCVIEDKLREDLDFWKQVPSVKVWPLDKNE